MEKLPTPCRRLTLSTAIDAELNSPDATNLNQAAVNRDVIQKMRPSGVGVSKVANENRGPPDGGTPPSHSQRSDSDSQERRRIRRRLHDDGDEIGQTRKRQAG